MSAFLSHGVCTSRRRGCVLSCTRSRLPSTTHRRLRPSLRMLPTANAAARPAARLEDETAAVAPRRRVAIIVEPTPFTHVSGYSNRFKTHIKFLVEAGDEVMVITPDDSPDAPTSYGGAKVMNVPGFRFPLYDRILLSFGFRGVYSSLRDFRPDVIHVSTPGFLTFATLVFARILRKPLLFSYHTHLPHYARSYGLGVCVGLAWWLIKVCHNRADATLATSPQLCGELRQQGVERVGLWPKGVDTSTFNPSFRNRDMRARLTEGNPHDNLIVYVGRLGAEKNLDSIKQMLAQLPANTRLALVGDGPYRETLKHIFRGTKTYFAGLLRGEELSQAFASADAFIMPSESETLGFVVMESMASGVPVVGARAGGIPDLIEPNVTGYLYEPGKVEEAVLHLRKILYDAPTRERLARAARAESELWSWRAATATTRNVHYVRAISSFRFRALWGLGLPRSLSWFRWLRRRLVLMWMMLTYQLLIALQY